MTSWLRLFSLASVFTSLLYVALFFTDPRSVLLFGFVTNILAAPFGQKLIRWVETGSEDWSGGSNTPIGGPSATPPSPRRGVDAVTALFIAATNIYALLFINIASAVLLSIFDELESSKLISFTDIGYIELQKYISGCLLLLVWLPAASFVSLALAGSDRRLSFGIFAAGTGLSLPAYLLLVKGLGFSSGFGDVTQPSLALGSSLPSIPGYAGLQITALLIQIAMLVFFGLILAFYAWLVARLARFILSFFTKFAIS